MTKINWIKSIIYYLQFLKRKINEAIKKGYLYLQSCCKKVCWLCVFIHKHIPQITILVIVVAVCIYFLSTPGPNDWCCGGTSSWRSFFERIVLSDELLNIQRLLVGVIGLLGLYLLDVRTKDQIKKTEDQVQRTKLETERRLEEADRRLDEKFDNAVNALSKTLTPYSYPAHLGAISSLTRLAIDSPENTQRCLDVLCSCNDWMGDYLNKFRADYNMKIANKYIGLISNYMDSIDVGDDYSDEIDLTLDHLDKVRLDYNYYYDLPNKGAELYPYKHLTENNRIVSRQTKEEKEVSILVEKRSQVVLRVVKEILIALPRQNKLSLDFKNKFLCGIDLSNWPAKDSKKYINLDGINFSHSHLNGAFMFNVQMKKANLRNTDMSGAMLFLLNSYETNFRSVKLWNAYLFRTKLESAELSNAQMQKSYIQDCNLQGVNLICAKLNRSTILDSEMQGVDLSHAEMKFINFVNDPSLKRINLNLQGANLTWASLQGTNFNAADMKGVNLSGSKLLGANFEFADLSYSIMINPIQLQGANIQHTNLDGLVFCNEFLDRSFYLNQNEEHKAAEEGMFYLTWEEMKKEEGMVTQHINDVWKVIRKPGYRANIKKHILAKGISSTDCTSKQIMELGEEWLKLCSNNMYVAGKLLRLQEIGYEPEDYNRDLEGLTDYCQNYIYKELEKRGKINQVRPPLSDD